jgi:hypothetical protein
MKCNAHRRLNLVSDNFIGDHMEVQCFDGRFLLLLTLRMCDKRISTAVTGHGLK